MNVAREKEEIQTKRMYIYEKQKHENEKEKEKEKRSKRTFSRQILRATCKSTAYFLNTHTNSSLILCFVFNSLSLVRVAHQMNRTHT